MRQRSELGIQLPLRGADLVATDMFNVALGWQIYEIAGNALILGKAGLPSSGDAARIRLPRFYA